MGLDQSGVPTVGLLVPKEGRHTLPHNTLLVIPPWCSKPPLFVGSPRSLHQGSPHATRGVCLGSSVLNPVHWPLLYRWERFRVIGARCSCLRRLSHFSAPAKQGR